MEWPVYRNLGCTDRHGHAPRVAWARMILRFDSLGSLGTNLVCMPGMLIFCESWILCLPMPGMLGMPILVLCLLGKPGSIQSLLSFTQIFRKNRLESKWNTTFWVVQQKISGNNGTSEKVVLVFLYGICQMEIRVPFLQSHL